MLIFCGIQDTLWEKIWSNLCDTTKPKQLCGDQSLEAKETINKSLRVCDRTSTGISWRIPFHQLFHERMLVHRTGGLERVFLAITLHSRVNNEVKTLWKVLSTCNATVHKKSKTLNVWLRICSAIYDLRKREIFQFTLTVLICVQTFMAWFKELQKLIKKSTLKPSHKAVNHDSYSLLLFRTWKIKIQIYLDCLEDGLK